MPILMKGNEALAEAAVRAGCRLFCGYPITPQSEILEYMSWRLPQVGGHFIQAESEIAAISMVYGAAAAGFRTLTGSSGPGFSLKQEGISYLAAAELPAVIVDVQRYGFGLGLISPGQGDYLQATRGGGHGGYRVLVYAPSSVQEMADLTYTAYEKAEEYRNPVLILTDGALGQMMEPLNLPPFQEYNPDKPWAVKGKRDGFPKFINTRLYNEPDYDLTILAKYKQIELKEQKAETVAIDDAEVALVSYGISARVCKEAVKLGREQGLRIGLVRPITLWPFPRQEIRRAAEHARAFLAVEMSFGQLVEDVALSVKGRKPVYVYGSGKQVPKVENILHFVRQILVGKVEEAF